MSIIKQREKIIDEKYTIKRNNNESIIITKFSWIESVINTYCIGVSQKAIYKKIVIIERQYYMNLNEITESISFHNLCHMYTKYETWVFSPSKD